MRFAFKSKRLLTALLLVELLLLGSLWGLYLSRGSVWSRFDAPVLDSVYAHAVQHGYGPPDASQIVSVTITDDSYKVFGSNTLDRAALARVNAALAQLRVAAVAYDIIFARPSTPLADERFAASLATLGGGYLPIGLHQTPHPRPFRWEAGAAFERLRQQPLRAPSETGQGQPLYATRALTPLDAFAVAAFNLGHISIESDVDGVYRRVALLLKIERRYLPTLALALFLDHVKVPVEHLQVAWGQTLTIPALPGSGLDRDVVIPIDVHGRTVIPYPQGWEKVPQMTAHALLQHMEDADLRGNLLEFFEGKFVFIGDVSTGIADMGHTPLDKDVPLLLVHIALLNGLLTHTFYRPWALGPALGLLTLSAVVLLLAALARASWLLPVVGGGLCLGLVSLTWVEMTRGVLFPIVTIGSGMVVLFGGLVIGIQVGIAKEQAFIRAAFAKYVSADVLRELMAHPERLRLGGEERVLTVLFSDLADFTTLAEQMAPAALVRLLNHYLTEMTAIVLDEGGIIDKFQGDGIMAEFGAPLPLPNHADLAVRTGLRMQRRLQALREAWVQQGLPALHCRVGINTGAGIIGNMGSEQQFDYTVMGDMVNLAARLEGANKQYKTLVMISEWTYKVLTPQMFRTRILDVIQVKGKSQAVKVYDVYGETSEPLAEEALAYYQTYEAAVTAYLARDFATARAHFQHALALRPHDVAAGTMLTRLATLDPATLPDDWDGSVAALTK